jgi:hypothetical protein
VATTKDWHDWHLPYADQASPRSRRVQAQLIEYDPRNVAAARERIARAGLTGVTVVCADAGEFATYDTAVPADLVLLVGVLGNITDDDAHTTIAALPQLCAAGATVIWIRTRRAPDLNPAIRDWFTEAGFVERAFHAPEDVLFSVGVHRFRGQPATLSPAGIIFRFVV